MARIEVIDQLHLERQTCECYVTVKRGDDRLVPPFHAARSTAYAPTHTRTGPTKPSAKAFGTPELPVK